MPKPDKSGNYGQLFSVADVEFWLGKYQICYVTVLQTIAAWAIKIDILFVLWHKNLLWGLSGRVYNNRVYGL